MHIFILLFCPLVFLQERQQRRRLPDGLPAADRRRFRPEFRQEEEEGLPPRHPLRTGQDTKYLGFTCARVQLFIMSKILCALF